MGIKIINAGLLTTIQDKGRFGCGDKGISQSGALDYRAMAIANALLGNDANEAVLEFMLFGPEIEFTGNGMFAITGADMTAMLNDKPVPMYRALAANRGDVLKFSLAKAGCCGYAAFLSGLAVVPIMNSKSTNVKCKLGGFKGRKLEVNDEIVFCSYKTSISNLEKREYIPKDSFDNTIIRVVLGPQQGYFTEKGIKTFLSTPYKLTNQYDRMGCKLQGEAIEFKDTVDIISDGIPMGGIQISANGQPIVMLSDRQTTGGYAKIATVATVDLPKFVQHKPGDVITFKEISVFEAQKCYKNEQQSFKKLRRSYK
jgi:antagonist of KipI